MSRETGNLPDISELAFGPEFLFGAATSAYQIEGCVDQSTYGRGCSIWDTYLKDRPHLDSGEVAIDHYRRMESDVALMKALGLQSYRFSVAWPRVLPKGFGAINTKGLDFYDRLVDKLLENDIIPNLTLYHWDLPQVLEDKGGWASRDTAYYFADYAAVVANRLGDRVPFWATLNEPEVIVAGYIGKSLAPGVGDYSLRMKVIHHLMLAHGFALQTLRDSLPKDAQQGIVANLVPIDPLTPKAETVAQNRWMRDYAVYLEAILKGAYPEVVEKEISKSGVEIAPGDMAIISGHIDFLGVNWYLRMVVNERDRVVDVPDVPRTLMGWEIRAEAFTRTLLAIHEEYRLPPVYITENGAALQDTIVGGEIEDKGRRKYFGDHLRAVSDAVKQGVDVRGYYAWSLFDNLEWSLGYQKTFGIVHVDRKTMERTPKLSAKWYASLIAQHRERL